MMKNMLIALMVAMVSAASFGAAISTAQEAPGAVQTPVQAPAPAQCPHRTTPRPAPPAPKQRPPESYAGLRGLAEVIGSPFELLRVFTVYSSEVIEKHREKNTSPGLELLIAVPIVTSIGGSVSVGVEVIVGSLDFVTFGHVGDATWVKPNETPYVFERRWTVTSKNPKVGICGM